MFGSIGYRLERHLLEASPGSLIAWYVHYVRCIGHSPGRLRALSATDSPTMIQNTFVAAEGSAW